MLKATFAAGCFWGVEATFRQVIGVVATTVGYMGGHVDNPTYEMVCTGKTGHAEVVQIDYDPEKVSYETLLTTFWQSHDPTTLNRQGPDIGTQYRSAIFFHSPEQKKIALASKAQHATHFQNPIVTEITPATQFYRAEEYHQQYFEKRNLNNCPI